MGRTLPPRRQNRAPPGQGPWDSPLYPRCRAVNACANGMIPYPLAAGRTSAEPPPCAPVPGAQDGAVGAARRERNIRSLWRQQVLGGGSAPAWQGSFLNSLRVRTPLARPSGSSTRRHGLMPDTRHIHRARRGLPFLVLSAAFSRSAQGRGRDGPVRGVSGLWTRQRHQGFGKPRLHPPRDLGQVGSDTCARIVLVNNAGRLSTQANSGFVSLPLRAQSRCGWKRVGGFIPTRR